MRFKEKKRRDLEREKAALLADYGYDLVKRGADGAINALVGATVGGLLGQTSGLGAGLSAAVGAGLGSAASLVVDKLKEHRGRQESFEDVLSSLRAVQTRLRELAEDLRQLITSVQISDTRIHYVIEKSRSADAEEAREATARRRLVVDEALKAVTAADTRLEEYADSRRHA